VLEHAVGGPVGWHDLAGLEPVWVRPDVDPAVYAEIQSALGRALVDTRRDVARGMDLVRAAQQSFENDPRTRKELQELVEWRRRHH